MIDAVKCDSHLLPAGVQSSSFLQGQSPKKWTRIREAPLKGTQSSDSRLKPQQPLVVGYESPATSFQMGKYQTYLS